MSRIYLVAALALISAACHAVQWERCALARELYFRYAFPRYQIPTWMCIAYRESRYDSTHINTFNADGSKDYGLFQINNRWWCTSPDSPYPNQNLCNVACSTVLYSMADTVECIKKMYVRSHNDWTAWATYKPCLNESNLEGYVAGCGI